MNPSSDDNQNNNLPSSSRATPQRAPIQWPSRATGSSRPTPQTDNDRAAELARQHVDRIYEREGEPNSPKTLENRNHKVVAPLNQQSSQQQHTMRNEQYNWDAYHTAWQQYYHQYFYQYYAGWWQQQKKQLEAPAPATTESPVAESTDKQQETTKELRDKIRSTVRKQSKKVSSSSHFKPALAAFAVGGTFLLLNYNQVVVGAVKQYVAPGSVATTPVIVEPNAQNTVSTDPKIIIPKIGVEAPVVYDEPKVDEASYQKALERGVVRLGNTANPGTKGNVVIGGHSSNNVFNPGGYKYVFVNLKRLDVGDIFYLNYNGTRYTYKVTIAKKIITPTETSVLAQTEQPTVTLFTCDPPGTNVNRLIVQAVQIDPDPSKAIGNTNQASDVNKTNPLPSVAPSLWDRLFGIFSSN